jgi:hypothetical protein
VAARPLQNELGNLKRMDERQGTGALLVAFAIVVVLLTLGVLGTRTDSCRSARNGRVITEAQYEKLVERLGRSWSASPCGGHFGSP